MSAILRLDRLVGREVHTAGKWRVGRLEEFRAGDCRNQFPLRASFVFQRFRHRRQKNRAHQRRFSRARNSGDDREPPNRKSDVDVLQIVRARAVDLDPLVDVA